MTDHTGISWSVGGVRGKVEEVGRGGVTPADELQRVLQQLQREVGLTPGHVYGELLVVAPNHPAVLVHRDVGPRPSVVVEVAVGGSKPFLKKEAIISLYHQWMR